MSRPSIAQTDEQIGFHWLTEDARPIGLADLVQTDPEPERLLPTHLAALDDALIDAAGRFGRLLGGGEAAITETQRLDLRELHRVLDRLCHEYAAALAVVDTEAELRAGLIVGTAQLIAIRARMALGVSGPTPLAGTLTDPGLGVVSGHGRLVIADDGALWRGARWVVQSEHGARYPLTLSMLLYDSSGVNKDAALDEHRAALRRVAAAAADPGADPFAAAGSVEWLLYDWLMAHRESGSSGAIELRGNRLEDARLMVAAADALVRARTRLDATLLDVPTRRRH
ncbi:hypothetical protein ABZS66_49775 [Dactylosporangium sp. NPDC005572]|uniref:hypothetical protein n=1 Tax=Dactylosporangium sp. NPDC005572 TaxID=3156889 RepID=UPI0033A4CEE5